MHFVPWFGALAHAIFFRQGSLDYFHTHICAPDAPNCGSLAGAPQDHRERAGPGPSDRRCPVGGARNLASIPADEGGRASRDGALHSPRAAVAVPGSRARARARGHTLRRAPRDLMRRGGARRRYPLRTGVPTSAPAPLTSPTELLSGLPHQAKGRSTRAALGRGTGARRACAARPAAEDGQRRRPRRTGARRRRDRHLQRRRQ